MQTEDNVNRFISLEGSEGAGKSTNLEHIEELLKQRGLDYFVTREPGGTQMAEEIRQILLANREEVVAPITELLLMFAARSQHVAEVIRPRLQAGQWIICDRFVDASYAYQGYARGIDLDVVSALERWVVGPTLPGLTLYLDLPPEVGAARIAAREKDRVENERQDFFLKVREGYLKRAASLDRFSVVDASHSLENVTARVEEVVTHYIDFQLGKPS